MRAAEFAELGHDLIGDSMTTVTTFRTDDARSDNIRAVSVRKRHREASQLGAWSLEREDALLEPHESTQASRLL